MPTTILNPTADGSEAIWTLPGGAGYTKWQGVLDPDDGDNTYIQRSGLNGTSAQTFVLEDLPAAAVSVSMISVRHRMRRDQTVSPPSACNGVLKLGADILGPVIGGAYWNRRPETYYLDFFTPDIAKLDASAWTVANVNAAQVGVRLASLHPPDDATENIRVTSIDVPVAWNAASAGSSTPFAAFVGSLIGFLIGSAVGLHEIPALARSLYVQTHGRHRIHAHEYRDLWRGLHAPRRVYA